jgi:excinuclease ABC subunit C
MPPPSKHPIIEGYLKALPTCSGVYRMINNAGDVLYVGKAKDLKKRVAAYVKPRRLPERLRRMVGETASMEFVTTQTEAEALLLEANLIKRFAPRYNILLRDDKTFPSILVTAGHDFPRVVKHRGHSKKGSCFGPFASAWAVNQTLNVLQRAFLLRTCSDSIFSSRSRPCLLYQIKRCSAPCVDRISAEEYRGLVDQARAFLSGDSRKVQQALAVRMQKASDALAFEDAARFRDRIRALTSVQSHQEINLEGVKNADVIAVHLDAGQACVQVFFFRAGRNNGNRAYFPRNVRDQTPARVLEAFLGQFYEKRLPPPEVFISHRLENQPLIAEALGVLAERRVKLACPQRGEKKHVLAHTLKNAQDALARRMGESASQRKLLERLADILDMESPAERIEVFDNSHVSGTNAVGAMIVAGPEGFEKRAYRKFTIKGAADPKDDKSEGFLPGDDYAMMREVLTRRFSRAMREDPDGGRAQWPDVVIIDGGAGQLGCALGVFEDLGIDDVAVMAIAKDRKGNKGGETVHLANGRTLSLDGRDSILYFLQRLRDEAHRFVIGAHRAKRSSAISKSLLDEIPGVGAGRKKALLHHFGSARSVAQAGRKDLASVVGVSGAMADKIYDWFHSSD